MTLYPLHFALALIAGVAVSACGWTYPTEPLRAVPDGVALPRFEEISVDFAHRWDRATAHHLSGAAVLDLDGDGREEIFVGGGAGQPDALLGLQDGRLVDPIAGTGLSPQGVKSATYGSCAIDLDQDGDVDLVVARNEGLTLYVNEGGASSPGACPSTCPRAPCR